MDPVLVALLIFPIILPFAAKLIWSNKITWLELGVSLVLSSVLTIGVYAAGKYSQTHDTEVWNGQITSKARDHDSYIRSYSCNCSTTCTGSGANRSCSESCQTCYETHYTVTWSATSTAGNFTFDHLDSTSGSVYNKPDPQAYVNCQEGQPASRVHSYTNYVQAVPHSLFNDGERIHEAFKDMIPPYPKVYNFYQYNRIINVGSDISENVRRELNNKLNDSLRTIGPTHQANILVILTNIADPMYRYAVESAWLGGEKNDIVVFISTADGKTIQWVDVMTWALNSGNELFHVKLRDELKAVPLDADAIHTAIISKTVAHYDRPQMKDYEYLADEIRPPTWVVVIAMIISFFGSIGLLFVFHRVDLGH